MYSPFLGMVQYFAFDFTPKGYANCNGALMSIQQNSALFALLGTYYGGNGVQTFGLPDLRGRVVVGQGNNYTIGEMFGTTGATLLTANMPMHTHTATVQIAANNNKTAANVSDPTNAYPAGSFDNRGTGTMYTATQGASAFLGAPTATVAPAGSNIPFSTLNPYLAVTACIAISGAFPSRN